MIGFINALKEIKGGVMSKLTNDQLMENGISLLEQSLEHFVGMDDSEHGRAIANVLNGLLFLGKSVYDIYRS